MRDAYASLKRMFINRVELNFQQSEQLTKELVEIRPFKSLLL
jgi:hypothetical protein